MPFMHSSLLEILLFKGRRGFKIEMPPGDKCVNFLECLRKNKIPYTFEYKKYFSLFIFHISKKYKDIISLEAL